MSRGFKWSLLAILILMIAMTFCPMASMMFPGWNCTKDEINIITGQGRHSRYIAFIRVSQETYDTAISRVLPNPVRQTGVAVWHPVNTFAPPTRHYSPHYRFHGALHQAKEVELLFKVLNPTKERQAQIAEEILRAWQNNRGDDGATDMLMKLWKETEVSNKASGATSEPAPGAASSSPQG